MPILNFLKLSEIFIFFAIFGDISMQKKNIIQISDNPMNILLIGSGGREHAIARTLSNSPSISRLWAYPGNPGIFSVAETPAEALKTHKDIIHFCKKNSIDLVVIGPEQPLSEGLSDELREAGFLVFGPSKAAAMLEISKDYAKRFMEKYRIPTAAFKTFTLKETKAAHEYIDSLTPPIVLKADGLAAGKGVLIAEKRLIAHDALDSMFEGLFGDAGKKVVIEEYLAGEEASILAVTDGKNYVTLASAQDHKRAFDGDLGKNTGGMGAYSPAAIVTPQILEKINDQIISRALKGMVREGAPFVGCLYAGLMINGNDVNVIEFNVRFGDPETQAVLSVFDGDFARLLYTAANGILDKAAMVSAAEGCACCVVLASKGYPDSYQKGFPITGIADAEGTGAIVFHAGTALEQGSLVTAGGRVLGVTGMGADLQKAIDSAYNAVEKISFDNCFYRKDIGKKGVKKKVL